MAYFVLNILITAFLVWFSFHIDKVFQKRNDSLINVVLVLIVHSVVQSIMMLSPLYQNPQFWTLIGKIELMFRFIFMITICFYCIQYPLFKRNIFISFLKFALMIAAVFLVVTKVVSYDVSTVTGITIQTSKISSQFPYTWISMFYNVFLYGLPAFAVLCMLIKPSNHRSPLHRQKMLMNVLAVLVFEIVLLFIKIVSNIIPLFSALTSLAYLAFVAVLYSSLKINILYDAKYIIKKIFEFFIVYIIPAVIVGFGVALVIKQKTINTPLFLIIVLALTVIFLCVSHYLTKLFRRNLSSFSASYEKQFETDLAKIDYDAGNEEVTAILNEIFASNIGTTGITVLMDYGADFETAYSSSGKNYRVAIDNQVFDTLLNNNRTIVFKNQLDSKYALALVKDKMLKIFEETNSEVCILLVEGRHILGMIMLESKRLGNVYTDYDYKVFTKLYSYLFLIGYYMHSVANESVVGTVNREIKMSDQIIHSIQENMDFVKNPKVDVGYLMVPAHNIGGEFIDLIRLTDNRHIFVLGGMSGKGITASMSMVILKSIIRTFLGETKDFKELVQKVNAFIRYNLPKGTFFAGVFALMDFNENVMYYINCGVPSLLLYTQAYNNVIEIQGDGRVLGFASNIEKLLKVKKVKLSPGDIIFACTEGLIESHSLRGETFGKDRIQKSIMENLSYPAEKISRFTHQNLLSFTSRELEADITILTIKYLSK